MLKFKKTFLIANKKKFNLNKLYLLNQALELYNEI